MRTQQALRTPKATLSSFSSLANLFGHIPVKAANTLLAFLLLTTGTVAIHADVLYLKNGRIYIGKALRASGATVKFRARGRTMTFPKTQVKKISYGSLDEKKIRAARAKRRAAWLRKRKAELAAKRKQEKALVKPVTAFDFKEKISKKDVSLGLVSPWLIVARSAVVPGWGHLAMDRPWVGWAYMAAFGGLLGNTLYQRNLAERARIDYRRSVAFQNQIIFGAPAAASPGTRVAVAALLNARDYDTSRKRIAAYNQSLGLVIGFYALQLLHAGWDAFSFGEEVNWDVGIRPERTEPGKITFRKGRQTFASGLFGYDSSLEGRISFSFY